MEAYNFLKWCVAGRKEWIAVKIWFGYLAEVCSCIYPANTSVYPPCMKILHGQFGRHVYFSWIHAWACSVYYILNGFIFLVVLLVNYFIFYLLERMTECWHTDMIAQPFLILHPQPPVLGLLVLATTGGHLISF